MAYNRLLQSVQIALENKTQKDALLAMDEIVDFCLVHENGKVFDGWDKELIRLMVGYHWAKKTLIVHYNEDQEIKGVFMWYNCNEDDGWEFINDWEADREDGDSIFLAFLFAEGKDAFKEITQDFLSRCPEALEKKKISIRPRNGMPTRVTYDNRIFKKILNN
jgi:hypothetical protein